MRSMKIMIADDDVLILNKLNTLLARYPEYEVIASAMTGTQAMKLLEQYQPDLLIADVEMPAPNGIELLRFIQKRKIPTNVLVLSNYNYYDYVHEAMLDGAVDYILKDRLTDPAVLLDILRKVEARRKSDTDSRGFSQHMRQKFLYRCLTGQVSPDEGIPENVTGISPSKYHYMLIWMQIVDVTLFYGQEQDFAEKVTAMVDSVIQRSDEGSCIYMGNGAFSIFLDCRSYIRQMSIIADSGKLIRFIEDILMRVMNAQSFFTYEICDSRITEISKYDRMCMNRMDELLMGVPAQESAWTEALSLEKEVMLMNAVYAGEEEGVSAAIARVIDNPAVDSVQSLMQMAAALCNLEAMNKARYGFDASDVSGDENFPHVRPGELREVLKKFFIRRFVDIIEAERTKSGKTSRSPYIREVMEYIRRNYDKDLSLSVMADHLHLTEVYFSHLFKQETGMSFTQYVCEKRIAVAKDLLQDSDLSIMEVAKRVGFHNYNYFIQVFKKVVRTTPLKYRASLGK